MKKTKNMNFIKEKILSLKKREMIMIAVVFLGSVLIYVKFSRKENNFELLMELQPKKDFVVEDIMEQEKRKVLNAIKKEDERNKGIGRDIFFSNVDEGGMGPSLTGVSIGRKKFATFSNGLILVEGDDFYGSKIYRILPRKVILKDNFGEERVLEIGRD